MYVYVNLFKFILNIDKKSEEKKEEKNEKRRKIKWEKKKV